MLFELSASIGNMSCKFVSRTIEYLPLLEIVIAVMGGLALSELIRWGEGKTSRRDIYEAQIWDKVATLIGSQ